MENKEIRRINLQLLVDEATSIIKLSDATDISPAYLSQILNQAPSSNKTPRGMGNATARKLEKKCGKPNGWMDVQHYVINRRQQRLEHLNKLLEDQPEYMIDEAISNVNHVIELLKNAKNNNGTQ